jgi:hypothetical protein
MVSIQEFAKQLSDRVRSHNSSTAALYRFAMHSTCLNIGFVSRSYSTVRGHRHSRKLRHESQASSYKGVNGTLQKSDPIGCHLRVINAVQCRPALYCIGMANRPRHGKYIGFTLMANRPRPRHGKYIGFTLNTKYIA